MKTASKQKMIRVVSAGLALTLLSQYTFPVAALALTSGPGQPEFSSFEPVGTTDMVDLYSGDFTYNIPLLSVPGPNGGYPINIAYHSGPGVDEEASWVGLGWNINVGAINRQLRGLPDDFNGDQVTQRSHLKENRTVALNLTGGINELFGVPPSQPGFYTNPSAQIYYNSYKGLGYRVTLGLGNSNQNIGGSLDLSFDSQNGIGVEPDFSVNKQFGNLNRKVQIGAGYNSRQGLQEASFSIQHGHKSSNGTDDYSGWSGPSLGFSTQFNVPNVQMPMRTNTYPYSLHVDATSGSPAWGVMQASFPSSLRGYLTESFIANNGTVTSDAYGYLYNSNSSSSDQLRDFQRENIQYTKKIPNLAPSSFTYDLFSQSAQGSGSQFRSYANNVGVLTDRTVENQDFSYPVNIEYGGSTAQHYGAGFTYDAGSNQSGAWQQVGSNSDVQFDNALYFSGSYEIGYQSSPFKVFGEKTGVLDSEDHLKNWGGDEAIKAKLDKSSDPNWIKRQYVAQNLFVKDETDPNGFTATDNHRVRSQERERRATNIEYVTDEDFSSFGFTRNIGYTYAAGAYSNHAKTAQGGTKGKHLSEIVTVQPDGMRYVYGIPAYNNVQYDGSFAVNAPANSNFNTKTVPIQSIGSSWQVDYSGTHDEFDQQTELGPYVHSWLLSCVVSPDYVDISNNGPTEDDYGYWVRFNYDKKDDPYYWHVPYEGANYYEGKKGDPTDDRGSYSCGNREEYYLQSIETKTHIAIFYLSERQDGIAAEADLNGGLPASIGAGDSLLKLDSIKLYTKAEFYTDVEARTLRSDPVALKTVHFSYTYELCGRTTGYYAQFTTNNTGASVDELGNSPAVGTNINANKGKLTLKKIWFTYQTSERGEFSPYLFDYGAGAIGSDDNPYYDPTATDRWGNYKKNDDYQASTNLYPYVDHPYTDQRSTQTAHEQEPLAGVWSLKKITLPSGAKIEVTYESDDYAYVEDQKAMRMFDIYALGYETDYNTPQEVVTRADQRDAPYFSENAETPAELLDGQYRVYFRLEEIFPAGASTPQDRHDYIKEHYLDNGQLKKMYFNTFMDLLDHQLTQEKDYVSGYAEIDYSNEFTSGDYPFGMAFSSNTAESNSEYDLGYILLKGEDINSPVNIPPLPKISPFIKAAFQHLHFNRSELVHTAVPYSNSVPAQIINLMTAYTANLSDIAQAMVGFNAWAYAKGYGKKMDLNGRSIIRLYEPDGYKSGGGSRVSKVTVNDHWDNDPTNTSLGIDPDNYSYGIEYNYEMVENGDTISSGVCYEPRIGGEESALRQPIEYVNSTPLHTDENLFLETPLLESYYPGAMVGYRKVTASSIAPKQADLDDNAIADESNILKHNAAPITIYEFYSPKEFPVFFDQTDINADPAIVRPVIIPGIYTSFTKRKARSQGYSIVLNDMAGKPRSVTQRTRPVTNNPNGTLISKMEYIYNTEKPFSDNSRNKLCSKVQVLMDDGEFQTASVGQTHDIFIDMNENIQSSLGGGGEANLDVLPGTPPLLAPTAFPAINKRELSMRTVVVNKIIYRTGIIKEVIATHEASTIKTESIAFDIETGEPLLTKTTNEFGDPIYQYTYPGHWFYDGLKGGYINYGIVVDRFTGSGTLSPMTVGSNGRISGIKPYLEGIYASENFSPGDEVWVDFASVGTDARCHVIKVGTNFIDLILRNGQFIPSTATVESIRVIRSGHDNMQSVAVGSLTSQSANVPQFDPQNLATTNKTSNTAYSMTDILNASAIELYDIMRVDCTPECALDNVQVGYVVDPYAIGTRGVWRPYASYAFSTDRTQADNIKADGIFTSFVPFDWADPVNADARWITASTITKYSPHGFELENKDANGIYSAALYEHSKTLNTAVASNAQYKEIAFESFEDLDNPSLCDINSDHWGFSSSTYSSKISTAAAHTGKQSIKLTNGQSVSLVSDVTTSDCESSNAESRFPKPLADSITASLRDTLDECDCNGLFSPNPDKKYMLMAWVKQTPAGGSPVNELSSFNSPSITVDVWDGSITTSTGAVVATGPVIDGWQRVYMTFDLPSNAVNITVTLANNSGTVSDDYFDDIRIQPYDANMMTYVYDPVTYRLVAQLDANNFATFYIYDEQGGLEKMKVETTEGIKTVKEGRMNMDKH